MTSMTAARKVPRPVVPVRRVSAFIYGNVLVLSALLVLSPEDAGSTRGFVYVLGIGISTYIAHVASDLFAHLLRHPDGQGLSARLPSDLRDAIPIASSAFVPTLVLLAAWLGWIEPNRAWLIAFGATVIRLSLLGPVSAWMARKPFSLWPLVAGILLALAIVDIALLKALLVH